jgi:pimeloyl-ACP methyl ester carboxylesterase
MKTLATIFKSLRWFTATLIVLFAIATFMGKSYGQTVCLVLIAVLLVYWPGNVSEKLNKRYSIGTRILLIIALFTIKQIFFQSDPKTSIYISEKNRTDLMAIYDTCLKDWPDDSRYLNLSTEYGEVHIIECGNDNMPPLVMLHAASMGAHSWAENLGPLLEHYHIFSIDNPGEGNRSKLKDALVYPDSSEELADFYSELLDSLRIDSAVVFGASNGGFIAQSIAYHHPEKVSRLALFGPMGLTQLTNGSVAMMSLATMYPFQFFRDAVAKWALGSDPACHMKYGDWFNEIMKGTIPSVSKPVPMSTDQKRQIDIPVLLFLGSNDRIVGDPEQARKLAEEYPNIEIEILESGHLIAVERAEEVNERLSEFLEI